MLGGFLLYGLTGQYRQAQQAGGRGMKNLPIKLLDTGPYAITRNPMYLGHLVFTAGLALALRSPLALVALVERWRRFDARVRADETRLVELFGDEYRAYLRRVPRWLPSPS